MSAGSVRVALTSLILTAVLVARPATSTAAEDGPLQFRQTASGELLDVSLSPGERATPAVEQLHKTARNSYIDNADAVAQGAELFATHCVICHGPEGTGRIGPNLVDENYLYPSNRTDKGLFESIYGGTVNLMTGWKGRLAQDDILKLIAYLRSLQHRGR